MNKIVSLIVKYGVKVIKWLYRAVKSGTISLSQMAVKGAQFLSKHPALLSNILSAGAGGVLNDIINSYAASKGIKTDEVTKYLEYVAALESDLNGISGIEEQIQSISSNHSPWWFNPNVKSHYYNAEDDAVSNAIFRRLVVHTLGYYAPFTLTDDQKNALFEAYKQYYARLNVGVTNAVTTTTSGQTATVTQTVQLPNKLSGVFEDLKDIIEYSWQATAAMLELQRMESAYLIDANGSYKAPFGLLGFADMNQVNPEIWESSSHLEAKDGNYTLWPSMIFPYDTTRLAEFLASKARAIPVGAPYYTLRNEGAIIDTMNARTAHGYRYKYGNISNADWATLVENYRTTVRISKNAWNLARYLYEGIFVDQPKEDNPEAYVFVSDISIGDNDGEKWYTSKGSTRTLLEVVRICLAKVREIEMKDKAYPALLQNLGISPMSNDKAQAYTWEFRRDLKHKTLIIKDTDDQFYAAMQNAAMMIKFPAKNTGTSVEPQKSVPFGPSMPVKELEIGSNNSVTSWNLGGPERGKIYIGDRARIKVGPKTYNLEPELKSEVAGEIAAVMKFGGIGRIRYYSRLDYDNVPTKPNTKGNWVLSYYNMSSTIIKTPNAKLNTLPIDYLWDEAGVLTNDNEDALNQWNFATDMTSFKGSFSVNNAYFIYCADLTDSNDDARISYVNRINNPGYALVDVIDLASIIINMYVNLYLNVGSSQELADKLAKISEWHVYNS